MDSRELVLMNIEQRIWAEIKFDSLRKTWQGMLIDPDNYDLLDEPIEDEDYGTVYAALKQGACQGR